MNFEQRVYNQEFKLNDTDDSIIEFIKNNRKNLQSISIQSIANELFVSPNAIMRTAKKLGYSGFSELKFSLQTEDTPVGYQTIESKVLDKVPNNIVRTLDVLDSKVMEEMVKDMIKANKILFAGVGDSVYYCELFGRYLRCIDKTVDYFQQIHDIDYAIKKYGEGDLVIIISTSGRTQRLVDLAKKHNKCGAKFYAITHYGKNPLSENCHCQLCFWGERRIVNGYNVTDGIGLMMIVRLVCESYWKNFICD